MTSLGNLNKSHDRVDLSLLEELSELLKGFDQGKDLSDLKTARQILEQSAMEVPC